VAGKARGRELRRLQLRQSHDRESFVREHTEHETAIAVEDGILEPAALDGIVGEEPCRQGLLQRTNCHGVQLPDLARARQIIRGAPAHALAHHLALVERAHDFLKWAPDLHLDSLAAKAIDREFVRSPLAAPLDQPPRLINRKITGGQIALNCQEIRFRIAGLRLFSRFISIIYARRQAEVLQNGPR
jgi:hypothetical protein